MSKKTQSARRKLSNQRTVFGRLSEPLIREASTMSQRFPASIILQPTLMNAREDETRNTKLRTTYQFHKPASPTYSAGEIRLIMLLREVSPHSLGFSTIVYRVQLASLPALPLFLSTSVLISNILPIPQSETALKVHFVIRKWSKSLR